VGVLQFWGCGLIKSYMRLVGHVARFGDVANAYNILVGKYVGEKQIGRPRCAWESNIKTHLKCISCGLGLTVSRCDLAPGACEHGYETMSPTKECENFDQLLDEKSSPQSLLLR
jgi:hypothetical protein